MVCTPENAPGVKEASVLNLSALSEDPALAKDSASSRGSSSQSGSSKPPGSNAAAPTDASGKLPDGDAAAAPTEAPSKPPPAAAAAADAGMQAADDGGATQEGGDTLSALPQPRPAARGASLFDVTRFSFMHVHVRNSLFADELLRLILLQGVSVSASVSPVPATRSLLRGGPASQVT
jgi:hypothetical protein